MITDNIQNTNLGRKASVGMLWLACQSIATKGLATFSQLVLASLLSKEDFGIIGLTYSVTSIVSIFINPGIDTVLIHRGKKFDRWSSAGVWLGLFCGLAAAVVMFVAAPVAAHLYGNRKLINMIWVLALATPLNAISIVPNALLSSQMRFRATAILVVINVAITSTLSIIMAFTHCGAYSFVVPVPIAAAITSAITWKLATPRLTIRFPIQRALALISDSAYMLGSRLLSTAVIQGSYILLGLLYSEKVVGIYYFGHMFAIQVVTFTGSKINTILLPALTKLDDTNTQARAGFRAIQLLGVIGTPLCFLQAICTKPALHLLYGTKWDDAGAVIEILSIALAIDVLAWPASAVMQAQGRFRLQMGMWVFCTILCLPLVFIGSYYGSYVGAAIGFGIYMVIQSFVWNVVALTRDGINISEITRAYLIPFAVSTISCVIPVLCQHMLQSDNSIIDFLEIIGSIITFGLCYFILCQIWNQHALQAAINRIRSK